MIAKPKVVMEPVESAETRKMANDARPSIDMKDDLINLSMTLRHSNTNCDVDIFSEDKRNGLSVYSVLISATQLGVDKRLDSKICPLLKSSY